MGGHKNKPVNKENISAMTGFIWHRILTSGGLLWPH